MITQIDISKLEDVFVTKKEFRGLDNKVALVDKKIDNLADTVTGLSNRVDGLSNRVDDLSNRVDGLSNTLQKTTEDLFELITTGFDSLEKSLSRINEQDSILDDHEKRIERIEEKAFKAN